MCAYLEGCLLLPGLLDEDLADVAICGRWVSGFVVHWCVYSSWVVESNCLLLVFTGGLNG